MKFCPKCGSLLIQKTKRFACVKCSYSTKEKIKIMASEKLKKETKIGVLHEKDANVWPTVAETCPKCGNDQAYHFTAQMRAADEAETRFYKCTKCKHSWRKYS